MSASEKLRAWDATLPPAPLRPVATWAVLERVRTALPLIIRALYEAERVATRRRGFLENDDLREALDELDKALT